MIGRDFSLAFVFVIICFVSKENNVASSFSTPNVLARPFIKSRYNSIHYSTKQRTTFLNALVQNDVLYCENEKNQDVSSNDNYKKKQTRNKLICFFQRIVAATQWIKTRTTAAAILLLNNKNWIRPLRRTVFILMMAFSLTVTAPANAASTTTNESVLQQIERILPSASLDKMVEDYTKQYMFADDVYDSVESAHIEAHADANNGEYPKKLADLSSTIRQQQQQQQSASSTGKKTTAIARKKKKATRDGSQIFTAVMKLQKYIEEKGVAKRPAMAYASIAFLFAIGSSIVSVSAIFIAFLRWRIQSKMKSRYGENPFTVAENNPKPKGGGGGGGGGKRGKKDKK